MCESVCACVQGVRACVHACVQACVHACMRACKKGVRACMHACLRACVRACVIVCKHGADGMSSRPSDLGGGSIVAVGATPQGGIVATAGSTALTRLGVGFAVLDFCGYIFRSVA